jgi:hypothetical protein
MFTLNPVFINIRIGAEKTNEFTLVDDSSVKIIFIEDPG